jgi:hypothetical protein
MDLKAAALDMAVFFAVGTNSVWALKADTVGLQEVASDLGSQISGNFFDSDGKPTSGTLTEGWKASTDGNKTTYTSPVNPSDKPHYRLNFIGHAENSISNSFYKTSAPAYEVLKQGGSIKRVTAYYNEVGSHGGSTYLLTADGKLASKVDCRWKVTTKLLESDSQVAFCMYANKRTCDSIVQAVGGSSPSELSQLGKKCMKLFDTVLQPVEEREFEGGMNYLAGLVHGDAQGLLSHTESSPASANRPVKLGNEAGNLSPLKVIEMVVSSCQLAFADQTSKNNGMLQSTESREHYETEPK